MDFTTLSQEHRETFTSKNALGLHVHSEHCHQSLILALPCFCKVQFGRTKQQGWLADSRTSTSWSFRRSSLATRCTVLVTHLEDRSKPQGFKGSKAAWGSVNHELKFKIKLGPLLSIMGVLVATISYTNTARHSNIGFPGCP